jgi:hypothetical protein
MYYGLAGLGIGNSADGLTPLMSFQVDADFQQSLILKSWVT